MNPRNWVGGASSADVRIDGCHIQRLSDTGLAFLIEHQDRLGRTVRNWFPVRFVHRVDRLPIKLGDVTPIITREWLAVDKRAPYVLIGEAGDVLENAKAVALAAPIETDGAAEEQTCAARLLESERQRKHAEAEAGPSASAATRFVRDTSKYIADEDLLADDVEP